MEGNLSEETKKLANEMVKQNSFKYQFVMSIVRGVGGVIGATLISAIVLSILVLSVKSLANVPVVKDYIDADKIDSYLKKPVK
jgi:hypothetical protein